MTVIRALAIAVAIAAGALGVWRGTWAVGGSDSSCYALMAQAFATGSLQPTSAFASIAPWPNRSLTLAPGGFVPSPVVDGAASPVCAPGFAVLLAPLHRIGGDDAIFFLTPTAGALLVYLAFMLGRELAGDGAGLASAITIAATPVFVFQIVQPMNDVVVATLWMAVLVIAAGTQKRPAWLGAVTGVALLVRPNLAPAAIALGLWILPWGWRRLALFAAAVSPFIGVMLLLNTALYGHALQTGYGQIDDLFSTTHAIANLENYSRALWSTQFAFPLIGLFAVFVTPPALRRVVLLALSISAAIGAVYLLYRPLPEWWYLRFLLPALAILTVLAMAAIVFVSRRTIALVLVTLVAVAYMASSQGMREAVDLRRLEGRFRTAATTARDRLPERAVFLTVWESGSVRYHAGREAVLWDSLEASSLESSLGWLSRIGYEPYIMIEDWEEPLFRERFSAHSPIGQLDWPPLFDIDRRVRIYRPADRTRFYDGEHIPTQFVRTNRR